jgi:hypothetical protein
MIKGLAFDPTSFFQILQCEIEDGWFGTYEIPAELKAVKRVVCNDLVFFISNDLVNDSASLIVVDLTPPHSIFQGDKIDRYVLDRMSTIVRSILTNSVSIPYNWHSHGSGSLQSVYAATKSVGGGARIPARLAYGSADRERPTICLRGA